jgi:hypothetical protein
MQEKHIKKCITGIIRSFTQNLKLGGKNSTPTIGEPKETKQQSLPHLLLCEPKDTNILALRHLLQTISPPT